jgi:hypothetical protein
MTTYLDPFTGQTISPSQTGYESLTLSSNTTLQWPINGNNTNVVATIIEVTATASNLALAMPPASQVSTGQSVLIRNTGSIVFNVTDNSGNIIATVLSGISWYIYVTSNSSTAGTWNSVQFGASASNANATTLAGAGLVSAGTAINQNYPIQTLNSGTTLNAGYLAQVVVWTGGVGTLTLPSASSLGNGWFTIIRNSGSGILTLTPSGSDTINGNSTQQLQLTESLVIVSAGTNTIVVGSNTYTGFSTYAYGRSNLFPYTQLAISVTGISSSTYTLTATQASSVIQSYSGVLSQSITIVLPQTVQLYSMSNQTSGSYSLSFKTSASGGTSYTLAQGNYVMLVSDGTNVYNAQSASVALAGTALFNSGSATAPSLAFTSDNTTGLYLAGTGIFGISAGGAEGVLVGSSSSASPGLTVPLGISGGTF